MMGEKIGEEFERMLTAVARTFASAAAAVADAEYRAAQARDALVSDDLPGLVARTVETLHGLGGTLGGVSLSFGCVSLETFERLRVMFGSSPISTSVYPDNTAIDSFSAKCGPGTVRAQVYPARPMTDIDRALVEEERRAKEQAKAQTGIGQ